MKKIITILLSLVAILAKGQEEKNSEFPTLSSRFEWTNFDHRRVVGFAHFVTTNTVVDLRSQLDGRNVFSTSIGPVLSRHTHDEIRLSLMPGLAYNTKTSELFYSGALFFKAEEIRGKEFYLYTKGMKTFKGSSYTFLAEGDLLFDLSNTFKLGPSFSVEISEHKEREVIYYDDLFNIGIRHSFSPLGWESVSLTGFTGWGNKFLQTKDSFGFINELVKNYFVFEVGVQISFFK